MNCAKAGELLSDHLYQDLSQEHQAQLEGHLDQCAGCAQQWQQMRAVAQCLDRAKAPLPESASPVPLLMRQATELRRNARRWRRGALVAGALAASVLLAIAMVDRITWNDGALSIVFGGAADRPLGGASSVPDPRVAQAHERIEQLEQLVVRLGTQQEQLRAALQQTVQDRTLLAGTAGTPQVTTGPAIFGLDDDDF